MAPKYRFGKRVPRHDARTLRFARYSAKLAAPPASVSWQSKVPSYPMDGNDTVGDCTIAAAAHHVETWTYNESPPAPVNFTTQDCLSDYYALTGGPDTGLDLLTVLNQWQTKGLNRAGGNPDVIKAFVQLKTGDMGEAQQAIALFGGAYIGLALPDFIVNSPAPTQMVWDVPSGGAVGPNAPNSNNGHCVPLIGYDANYIYFVTWGAVVQMTWAFYAAYSDEGYVALSQDWLGSGTAPSGFDLTQLEADLVAINAVPPVPIPPQPVPWQNDIQILREDLQQLEQGFLTLAAIFKKYLGREVKHVEPK